MFLNMLFSEIRLHLDSNFLLEKLPKCNLFVLFFFFNFFCKTLLKKLRWLQSYLPRNKHLYAEMKMMILK